MSLLSAAITAVPLGTVVSSDGVGPDCMVVARSLKAASEHYEAPVTRQSLRDRFLDLAETWRHETAYSSSLDEIVMNRAYQQIIGLGPDVIPLILRELQEKPDHWFWALKALTAADPVSEQDRGDIVRMADVWIEWGRMVKYLYPQRRA